MRAVFVLSMLLLSGCAVKTDSIYVPLGLEVKRSSCGAPYARHNVNLAHGVSGSFSARHSGGALHVGMSLSLEEGHSVKLLAPSVTLSSPDLKEPVQLSLQPFRAVLYSKLSLERGDPQQYEANEEIRGLGRTKGLPDAYASRDNFQSFASIFGIRPKEISLQLPTLIVDGQSVGSSAVSFVLQEETYALTCIQ
jgi:hypothetical protein